MKYIWDEKERMKNFIDKDKIVCLLKNTKKPNYSELKEILQKSFDLCETLSLEEVAKLISVDESEHLELMYEYAAKIKKKVYDNRIVVFAPLYVSNYCMNNCLYCGFRVGNKDVIRKTLSLEEIKKEVEILAGEIGHKRLILVVGEHIKTDAFYISDVIKTIYSVKVITRKGFGQIRRVNLNAAPMSVKDLKLIKDAGIGTYQVFQETYDKDLYKKLHPKDTPKSDFEYRLYAHHRAFEAGIDDVAIGALFGLGDWRFEVLGLVSHAKELENTFGIGPHTVSFPRLEKAYGSLVKGVRISDEDFKKLIAILRISIPYAGLIVTCRETPQVIRSVIPFCTQRDASTKIGIGAYSERMDKQSLDRQQFELGDIRSLEEVVAELAEMGYITSFCTSGYRCGRTGDHIMKMLKSGRESSFCKLNAVLTFKEWVDDFSSENIKNKCNKIIQKEIDEIISQNDRFSLKIKKTFLSYFERISNGERDICL